MYPTQNYQCYPSPMQYANPYAMPQVNAVKIDINNPQAYGGMNSQGQMNPIAPTVPQQCGPYNYPFNPIYSMPTVPQYMTPGAYPQPPMIAPPMMQPFPATPVAPLPAPAIPMPVPTPIPPVPVVPVATTPAPKAVVETPAVSVAAPVAAATAAAVTPAVASAAATATAPAPVAPVAPVAKQAEPVSNLNVTELLNGLSSTNADNQTAAIQKIAEIAQTDPVAAKGLLNEQVFGQLVNVINADTSKLQGPTGKPDPKNLSALEKAEINKQFAVYTLAILQKNFREEINKEMKKNNLPDIAINDLPYIKEGIVNNLKDNPNPTIREACLSALNYVGRPEDKQVLKILYDISAKHDASPTVKAAAKDYLAKLPA